MEDTLKQWFIREVVVHEGALMRHLSRVWPDRSEIRDIRQEAYIRVYEAAARSRPLAPKSFLFATARNLMADRVRRNRVVSIEPRAELDALNLLVDEISPERRASARQELGQLARAFELLPTRCRHVMWLAKVECLPQREIAARLGINEKAVEKQVSRGMRLLAAALAGDPTAPVRRRVAAGVLLTLAVAAVGYFWPKCESFHTAVGAVAAVPMSDGSTVTLNTDSQVRIAVTSAQRRVELGRGEAFFEVAKDPVRPFVVIVGNCKVTAVGTKFSVWRAASEVRITVTEGRVRVERTDSEAPNEAPEEVSAGDVVHARSTGVVIELKRLSEVEENLSWRRGYLFFHDVPLATAVAEFNRYNREKIVIGDPAIATVRIGGNFRANNLAGFVRLLEDGFSIHVQRRDGEITLTGG
jgi:RNA polymerase sigma factor (sigma-70 family)